MFTNKKREGINRFVCDVSLYVAETPEASIKYHTPPLPIIPFVRFCWTTFLETAVYDSLVRAMLYDHKGPMITRVVNAADKRIIICSFSNVKRHHEWLYHQIEQTTAFFSWPFRLAY